METIFRNKKSKNGRKTYGLRQQKCCRKNLEDKKKKNIFFREKLRMDLDRTKVVEKKFVSKKVKREKSPQSATLARVY